MASDFTTVAELPDSAQAALRRLESDLEGTGRERRASVRVPFFQPVTLTLDRGQVHPGFTRDFSTKGLGLLHSVPLSPGTEVNVDVPWDDGILELRVWICWCLYCGHGWYASGGPLLDRWSEVHVDE